MLSQLRRILIMKILKMKNETYDCDCDWYVDHVVECPNCGFSAKLEKADKFECIHLNILNYTGIFRCPTCETTISFKKD